MKFVISLLLCSVAVYADDKCEEGTTWMMECNSCTCMNGAPACTEMACPPRGHSHKRSVNVNRAKRSEELVVKPNSYKENCKPGDSWRDQDCNGCTCDDIDAAVKATCTRRLCPNGLKLTPTPGWENMFNIEEQHDRKKRSKDYGVVKDDSYLFNCRQGDTWTTQNCNTCICDEHGVVCTDNACPDGKKLTLTPGWETIFNIINNEVALKRDKRSDARVVKPYSYSNNCRLGDMWEDQNCNDCYCDKIGAVCTRRLCYGAIRTPTPGWEDMFNINEDIVRSIQRSKRSEALVIKHNSYKQNCQIGDRWKDQDCNRCWCGDDNKAVCTKRKCSDLQKLDPTPGWENMFNIKQDQQDRKKRSQQYSLESEWRSERVPRRSQPGPSCRPGESYFDGCNFCQCQSTGIPSCTFKGCASYNENGFPTGVGVAVDPPAGGRPPYIAVDPPKYPTTTVGRPPYIAVDPPKYPTTNGGRPPYIAVDPPKYPTTTGGRPPYIAVDPPKYPTTGGRPPYIAVDPTYNPNNNRGGYQG